jgi:hypothetical protein
MSTRCTFPGCRNWAFEAGLCRSHPKPLSVAADGAAAPNPFASLVQAMPFLSSSATPPPDPPHPVSRYLPVAPDALKLPDALLSCFRERGLSLKNMMEDFPENVYMSEIDMMLRDLMYRDPAVHAYEIINVKDSSAFTNFFSGPSKNIFSKWLVLFDLNEKLLNSTQTGDRFPAEHYVPPVATLLMQSDTPLFVVNKCLDVLSGLHQAGESAVRQMCKIDALPQFLARLVDQLCQDEDSRNAVGACGLMACSCVELLCNIAIKCCADHALQV